MPLLGVLLLGMPLLGVPSLGVPLLGVPLPRQGQSIRMPTKHFKKTTDFLPFLLISVAFPTGSVRMDVMNQLEWIPQK